MRRRTSLNFNKQHKKRRRFFTKETLIWAIELVVAVVLAFFLVQGFGIRTSVVGSAMADQLKNGDKVFINKVSYMISDPKAGDVVVFLPNGNEKSHYYVRRVVGVPGDRVQIREGVLYINGSIYTEETQVDLMAEAGIAEQEIVLGDGEYFLLGDNRNNSEDSRYANIGNIKREYIHGKAWLVIEADGGFDFVK